MDSSFRKVFTTEQVAALLGLEADEKWRVTKFVQSREYGIKPSISGASGTGSRRLYDIENVCEIGLALRLLETGLRPKVIGHVLKEARSEGKLSRHLQTAETDRPLYLEILVSPQKGKPLDASRIRLVDFVESFAEVEVVISKIEEQLEAEFSKSRIVDELVNYDVLLVSLGLMFVGINERLLTMESESGGKH